MTSFEPQDIAREAPRIILQGDAQAAQDIVCTQFGDRDARLPENLVLFNTPYLDQSRIVPMVDAIFAGADKVFVTYPHLARASARIGRYGFSFPQWRYLAQNFNEKSILEKYGMKRLRRDNDVRDASLPDPQRDEFGPGFVWQSGGWYVEYRRAYVLAANEEAALLIRNNSYFFGRDRLPNAAYVAQGRFSPEELQAFDLPDLEKFTRWQDVLSNPSLVQQAQKILDYLDIFEMRMTQWMMGSGRRHLLEFMQYKLLGNAPTQPYLAGIDPQLPPWFPRYAAPLSQDMVDTLNGGNLKSLFGAAAKPGIKTVILSGPQGDFPIKPNHLDAFRKPLVI